jgi:hypothetical protein
MAISTYTELKTAVDNWLARTDLADRAPEFIALAEGRMNRELETRAQEKRVTANTVADDSYVSLPTDVRQVRHVRLNTNPKVILKFLTPEALDATYPSTGTGKPRAYSVIGTEIVFSPTPDAVYEAEIAYVGDIDALGDSTATNTILARHPDAYLHGALAEAFTYLMDDQRAARHDQMFARAVMGIQADEERAKWGQSPTIRSPYGEV